MKNEQLNSILEGKRFIFITGVGRVGTKFIAEYLHDVCELQAYHEPSLAFTGLDYFHNVINEDEAWQQFIQDEKRLCLIQQCDNIYIEVNNKIFSLIPVIKKHIPQAKFIHITRDLRDIVRSMYEFWRGLPYEKVRGAEIKYFPNDEFYVVFNTLDIYQKVTWWCMRKDEMIYNDILKTNDCITIKFEDIFYNNNIGMIILLHFVDNIKTIDDVRMKIKVHSFKQPLALSHYTFWDTQFTDNFMLIAKQHLKRMGYIK